jgi:hypothetical protein
MSATVRGSQSVKSAAVTSDYADFTTADLDVRPYDRIFVHMNPTGSGPTSLNLLLQSVTNSVAASVLKVGSDGVASIDELTITVSDLPAAVPLTCEGVAVLRIRLKGDTTGLTVDLRITGSVEDGTRVPQEHNLLPAS